MNDDGIIFGRKCPHDDWQCPNAHPLYSNPSIMVAFAQKKAGVINQSQFDQCVRSACVMCKLDKCDKE